MCEHQDYEDELMVRVRARNRMPQGPARQEETRQIDEIWDTNRAECAIDCQDSPVSRALSHYPLASLSVITR